MPNKKNHIVPGEFPKPMDPPEVSPDSIPGIVPLPGEQPLKIPSEDPVPKIPEEQIVTSR